MINKLFFIIISILVIPYLSFGQEEENELPPANITYLEIEDDAIILNDRRNMPVSPAYSHRSDLFFFTQVNINENGENLIGDAANEPSIAVDPNNRDRIVIGWRQFDDVSSNFRQAGFAYTEDGGETWTFPGVIEPGVFRSDPVLAVDSDGNFYYNSLSRDANNRFNCIQFKSKRIGEWDEGTFAYGGDKQWMIVDHSGSAGDGNNYVSWNSNFTFCNNRESFTRSTDGNESYELCSNVPFNPFWGTMDVDVRGHLYAIGNVSNTSKMVLNKSISAKDSDAPMEWEQNIMFDLGGNPLSHNSATPNPGGILGQLWISVDKSNKSTKGNVYVLGSVRTPNDLMDVHFVRSVDGGLTFSSPLRLNDDTGSEAYQWFGTMSVAPNGRIDVVWLDTRNNPGSSFLSQLYYVNSFDGGESWSPNVILYEEPFHPHVGWPNQNKTGDYFHMVSDNEGADLAWAATYNNEQDVYYGRIKAEEINTPINQLHSTAGKIISHYPNPFSKQTNITFSIKKSGDVQVKVINTLGISIQLLFDQFCTEGDHHITWEIDPNKTQKGMYIIEVWQDGIRIDAIKTIIQ